MRYIEILTERGPQISDQERAKIIDFMMSWLGGSYMAGSAKENDQRLDAITIWQRIHDLFPPRINRPIRLFRLVTLPVKYADLKTFHLDRPALKAVSSWTSTHFGLESVHGITSERYGENSCRMAIQATISPENILASHQSLRRAFSVLTHDYEYPDPAYTTKMIKGEMHKSNPVYPNYLGKTDESFHSDLVYYKSLFDEMKGGPLRQYEFVVKTTSVEATNIRVYRRGEESYFSGHDDPHNSDSFRGWYKE